MFDALRLKKLVSGKTDYPSSELIDSNDGLYDRYGLARAEGNSREEIFNGIAEKIANKFMRNGKSGFEICKKWKKELISRNFISNLEIDRVWMVVQAIEDSCRKRIIANERGDGALVGPDDLEGAIYLACEFIYLKERLGSLAGYTFNAGIHERELNVCKAASILRGMGIKVSLISGELIISEIELKKAHLMLLRLIERAGKWGVLEEVFSNLRPRYRYSLDRYLITRRLSLMGGLREPLKPYGYLINSVVSCADVPPVKDGKLRDRLLKKVFELATSLCSVIDVEQYSMYEVILREPDQLAFFVRELAIFDYIFAFPQMRLKDSLEFLPYLSRNRNVITREGWGIEEVVSVAESLLRKFRSSGCGPCDYSAGELVATSGVEREKALAILDAVFAHPNSFNKTFLSPLASSYLVDRPLIRKSSHKYCMVDARLAAIAVVEAVLSKVREGVVDIDRELGKEIERFLKEKIEGVGLSCASGKYRYRKLDLECDLVVETDDTIFFIEIKKKPLTRKSRSGDISSIVVDLSESLLATQTQLGYHEVALRELNSLPLEQDNGDVVNLSLNNRHIERISLTLFDYGSFHDRVFLEKFLSLGLGYELNITEPGYSERLKRFQKRQRKLRDQYTRLSAHDQRYQQAPFYNCWFLSVQVILLLLDGCNCGADFKSRLWSVRHVTGGTLDFYAEYNAAFERRAS
jgi:hypothetical protein